MILFLSFTSLWSALLRNEISAEELDAGLFYLGCSRAHALDPTSTGASLNSEWLTDEGKAAHQNLVLALKKAESTGRCRWFKQPNGKQLLPFTLLSDLLETNGFRRMVLPEVIDRDEAGTYSYPEVRRQLEDIGSPLKVFYAPSFERASKRGGAS